MVGLGTEIGGLNPCSLESRRCQPSRWQQRTSITGDSCMGNIFVVCSHRRGDDTVVLCCVSEVEEGKAIAFQINGLPVETNTGGYEFTDLQEAEETLRYSTWPHA